VEPISGDTPTDAVAAPTGAYLRGLVQSESVVLTFPLAFFPPFIVTALIAHSVPAAVSWAVTVVGTAVLWPALWLRPSVRFTADALQVRLVFGRHRVAWADVTSVRLEEIHDSETDTVSRRVVRVTYRRDPAVPVPPAPSRFGDMQRWSRENFRSVRLPLSFPAPPQGDGPQRTRRGSPFSRRRERQRETIRRELTARGYRLPE
jgi:hypothetical protein